MAEELLAETLISGISRSSVEQVRVRPHYIALSVRPAEPVGPTVNVQGATWSSSRVYVVVAATISPGVAQLTGMGVEAVRVVEEEQAPSEAADAVADANGLRVQAPDMR